MNFERLKIVSKCTVYFLMNRKSSFARLFVISFGMSVFSRDTLMPIELEYFSMASFPKCSANGAVSQHVLARHEPEVP